MYFDSFPFDEQAVRDFLGCMQVQGYFEDFNVITAPLSEMIGRPGDRNKLRLTNVTVGAGTHNTMMYAGHPLLDQNYTVNEGEVYITYDTTQHLSGGMVTIVMQRTGDGNKIIKKYVHSRS